MSSRPVVRKRLEIPSRADLTPVSEHDIDVEITIERGLLADVVVDDDRFRHGMIDSSRLVGVTGAGASADGVIVRRSGLERCDWSNASAESSSWSDTLVEDCKLTGTRLNRAVFRNVEFSDVRADLAQFQHAKMERVVFTTCDLRHAFFNGAKMAKTIFDGCDLREADFSGSDISGSDLRRSRIEGIRIAPEQLQGVIVTQDQALYLAGLIGLVVRD